MIRRIAVLALRVLLSGIFISGSFALPRKDRTAIAESSDAPVSITVNVDNLFAAPEPKKIELEVVKEPEPIQLPAIMLRIKTCESGGNYEAQNKRSTASGAFQFLDSTWAGYGGYAKARLAPPRIQDEFALLTYQRSGTRPWNASKGCWARTAAVRSNLTANSTIYDIKPNAYATDCVRYLRLGMGVPVPQNAYAKSIRVDTKVATAGMVIVTYEGKSGHFGYVLDVKDGLIYIQDGNYRSGYMTKRTLPVGSSVIKGFISV